MRLRILGLALILAGALPAAEPLLGRWLLVGQEIGGQKMPVEEMLLRINAAGPALEFSGPITALWSAGNSATAVSRDLQTGRYAAYSLAPTCGS